MALKAKIQPHFLFNTLNTIVHLIRNNPESAVSRTQQLADLYRYILKVSDVETIALKEELDCINKYLLIEQERFGEKLHFEIDLPEDWLQRKVPSLILQPLIENCIRHGLNDCLENCQISIRSQKIGKKESIVVSDNGTGIGSIKLKNLLKSDRYGLKSVNERWMLTTGNPLRIESKPNQGTNCYLDWN